MTGWRPRSRSRIAGVLAGVLALHLLLAVLLGGSPKPRRSAMPAQRVTLRLLPLPAPPPQAGTEPAPRPGAVPRLRKPAAPREARDPVAPAPGAELAITVPTPAASAPDAPPSLMGTDATRRAIRDAARAPSLAEQLARSREEPARASVGDRLSTDIKRAGKGDCAKGAYAGAGMGLLSLPFLAVAAATDNCAK